MERADWGRSLSRIRTFDIQTVYIIRGTRAVQRRTRLTSSSCVESRTRKYITRAHNDGDAWCDVEVTLTAISPLFLWLNLCFYLFFAHVAHTNISRKLKKKNKKKKPVKSLFRLRVVMTICACRADAAGTDFAFPIRSPSEFDIIRP